jgi:hypothetical protein
LSINKNQVIIYVVENMKKDLKTVIGKTRLVALSLGIILAVSSSSAIAFAGDVCGGGRGESGIKTSIDIGCVGKGNPIADMTFAFIRVLSVGVGLVVVGSIIVAGIQYTTSRGDPKATAAAETRIKSSVVALLIYIFGYAILNYIIPAGFLH